MRFSAACSVSQSGGQRHVENNCLLNRRLQFLLRDLEEFRLWMLSIERIEGKAAGNQSITRSGRAVAEGTAESLRLHSSAAKQVAGEIVIGEHHTSQANKIDL